MGKMSGNIYAIKNLDRKKISKLINDLIYYRGFELRRTPTISKQISGGVSAHRSTYDIDEVEDIEIERWENGNLESLRIDLKRRYVWVYLEDTIEGEEIIRQLNEVGLKYDVSQEFWYRYGVPMILGFVCVVIILIIAIIT